MGANAQTAVPAFTTGQVLTAAQMTEVNTGIPVFATTTTRDDAFDGSGEKVLAEGQYAYIEATSTLQVYTGSAWVPASSAGLIPMVPTSVAVGSGTGTANTLGQVTFSGVSSVSLNGVFTSSYKNYQIVCAYVPSTTVNTSMRLRAAGSDNSTASSYVNQIIYASSTSVLAERTTLSYWGPNFASGSNLVNAFTGTIFQPQLAAATGLLVQALSTSGNAYAWNSYATHNQTTAYDGFTIYPDTGTLTGTISVYGYNQ
jgi:hypothetical protein